MSLIRQSPQYKADALEENTTNKWLLNIFLFYSFEIIHYILYITDFSIKKKSTIYS